MLSPVRGAERLVEPSYGGGRVLERAGDVALP